MINPPKIIQIQGILLKRYFVEEFASKNTYEYQSTGRLDEDISCIYDESSELVTYQKIYRGDKCPKGLCSLVMKSFNEILNPKIVTFEMIVEPRTIKLVNSWGGVGEYNLNEFDNVVKSPILQSFLESGFSKVKIINNREDNKYFNICSIMSK